MYNKKQFVVAGALRVTSECFLSKLQLIFLHESPPVNRETTETRVVPTCAYLLAALIVQIVLCSSAILISTLSHGFRPLRKAPAKNSRSSSKTPLI